ncbi:MAG: T9SS type A sorting domain-containing protein [candidate division Zixibacteria bacterium]
MKRTYVLIMVIIAGMWLPVSGTIINVPDDYLTIQEGIDASTNGDTVLVQPGTYVENVVSDGNNIAIGSLFLTTGDTSYISSTIIDGNSAGPVFSSNHDYISPAIFAGFTVQNGSAFSGGGIYCQNSSIEIYSNIIKNNVCEYNGGGIYGEDYYYSNIYDNVIIDNHAGYRGGGAYFIDSMPIITNNRICDNVSDGDGGGVYFWDSHQSDMHENYISGNYATGDGGGIFIKNTMDVHLNLCVIADNSCLENGGGIAVWDSRLELTNCTLSRNLGETGGGIFCDGATDLNLLNSILWSDSATVDGNEIFQETNNFFVDYCDVQGGMAGHGNIDADPMFVDPENGDFHLQQGSPCIDAGDPSSPYDPDGTFVDMGAYYYGPEIPEIIDQSQMIATEGFWFDEGVVRWQQFFPTLDNISAVEIFIRREGSPGDVIVQITTDSGEILSESTVDENGIPGNDWIMFNLPETIDLVPGEPYRIVVTSSQPSPSPDERYRWSGNHDSDYPGITDVYDEEPFYDYAFITYGYDYRLDIEDTDIEILPTDFILSQNYPNPFNASTLIEYGLPNSSDVTIEIFDILGRKVETLIQGEQQAGYHQVTWDASEISSGMYFYRIQAGKYVETKKMLLLK